MQGAGMRGAADRRSSQVGRGGAGLIAWPPESKASSAPHNDQPPAQLAGAAVVVHDGYPGGKTGADGAVTLS